MGVIGRGFAGAARLLRRATIFGPYDVDGHAITLRTPRLRDGRAWSAARLANREWLERAFPAWGDDWVAEQTPAAWVERCWHLRVLRTRGAAHPFVVLVDGRLVGELGVDAVDETSATGEASVWMVQDRGSHHVMNVSSLLLTYAAFCGDEPLNRLISPVATSSRRGRAPGLQAAGLTIEATLPRPVGRGEAVDHDIWVLHNTAAVRARTERAVDSLPQLPPGAGRGGPGSSTSIVDALVVIRAAAVAGLRAARRARSPRSPSPTATHVVSAGDHRLVHHGDGRVEIDHTTIGHVRQLVDIGTATAALIVRIDHPSHHDTISTLVASLADDVDAWAPTARWVQVRVTPPADTIAPALTATGFEHVASFDGNIEAPRPWPGEEWWSRAVT